LRGRGGRNNVRGGRVCGGAGRGGRSQRRGKNYTGSANAAEIGLCTNLGTNVFEYDHKSAAGQMCTSWGKLVHYFGTNYGQDINNELQNKITVLLIETVHTDDVLMRHSVREVMIRTSQLNIQRARQSQETILRTSVLAVIYLDAPMNLAILHNEISQGKFAANVKVPVELNDYETTQFSNDFRTFRESNANLINHRGQ
jgi:hypothetical protein